MNKKILILILATIHYSLFAIHAYAHAPSSIETKYDHIAQTISVTVTHSVRNTQNHYIKKITLTINAKEVDSVEFTSQEKQNSQSAVFDVTSLVKPGYRVIVNAFCSMGGKIDDRIPITAPPKPKLHDGTYEAQMATIKVEVAIEDEKIKKIRILEHKGGKKNQYYFKARRLVKEIVDKQSADVEAITGATMSCEFLKEAVKKALEKAHW